MRYGFINNFSQILASDLAIGATNMTLDGGGALLSAATVDLVYTLTLDDGNGTTEIIHVTGQTTNTLTIVRAQEGTTAQAWPTGSTVEMRVTAGAISNLFQAFVESVEIGAGVANSFAALTESQKVGTVAIGDGAYLGASGNAVTTQAPVVLGWDSGIEDDSGYGAVIIGADAYLAGSGAGLVSIGTSSTIGTQSSSSVALGSNASVGASSPRCVVAGDSAAAWFPEGVSIGQSARCNSPGGTVVGWDGNGDGVGVTLLGKKTSVTADSGVAIGAYSEVAIAGGCRINAVQYLPAAYTPDAASTAADSASQASSHVVIATDPLDLTDGASTVTLDLPAGTRLFMDSIDVIITGSNTPGGSPEISVGPDGVTPAAYLASTLVTKTSVGERQTHAPLVTDGVTSLRVATTVAGTGTIYQAKIVFRGYVMEL